MGMMATSIEALPGVREGLKVPDSQALKHPGAWPTIPVKTMFPLTVMRVLDSQTKWLFGGLMVAILIFSAALLLWLTVL